MSLAKLSLRARIALLTGAVILTVSLLLTFFSMHNANEQLLSITQAPTLTEAVRGAAVPADAYVTVTGAADSPGVVNAFPADGQTGDAVLSTLSVAAVTARREFNYWSLLACALIAAGGMLAAWLLAGRALRPVRRLEAAVSDISARNLTYRLPAPAAQDEIGRLTCSFNAMLDRLEQSFERQKRFSSSVAHELKTPLATMKLR